MSENNTNVPKIRFPGFTDAWEQRKVGDYYDFKNGLNKGKEFFGHGVPIINFTDVFHNRGINASKLKGKVDLQPSEIANYKVQEGDIFFTRTSETIDEIGYPSVMLDGSKDTVFSGFVLRGRAIGEDPLTLKFKRYVFYTDEFRKEMIKKSSMTTRALTSGTAIKQMEFHFPKDKREQDKIGDFFTRIDNLITLHQRKLGHLQDEKKSLLQKMFPKNGADVPEIRFPGFTHAWEQRKLSEVMSDFIVPMRDKPKEFSGDIPWTRIEDIEGKYLNSSLSGQYVSEKTIKKMNLKIIPKGSLIVSASATFGVVAVVTQNLITNQTFIGLVPEVDFDLDFLYTFFQSPTVQMKMRLESAGSTIFYISRQTFEDMKFSFPDYAEQRKLGSFFSNLDNLINLHQRKLNHLQEQKKSLLQQMFV